MTQSQIQDYKTVKYKNKIYNVVCTNYKEYIVPFIIDAPYLKILKSMNLQWNYKKHGQYIYTIYNGSEVFLHNIIVNIYFKIINKKLPNCTIEHINKIGIDNRISNLKFNEGTRNQIKKKRTVDLSKWNIKADDIPTYVWYMKPTGNHGARFSVKIGNEINWKTTSSKNVSLWQKLEDAKKYLYNLQMINPDLFEQNCMNGEFTEEGKEKLNECYNILKIAGFKNIDKIDMSGLTLKYLIK